MMRGLTQRDVVRLEDSEGRLITYASVETGRLISMPLKWRSRVCHPFGQFRLEPGGDATLELYRERADDGNDPATCHIVTDELTPRGKP